jgi:hypothetical protein
MASEDVVVNQLKLKNSKRRELLYECRRSGTGKKAPNVLLVLKAHCESDERFSNARAAKRGRREMEVTDAM